MRIKSNKINNMRKITAATESGTVFYKCKLDQVIQAEKDNDCNTWLLYALIEYGWNAIDFDHNMYGSAIIDDELYICKTDGYEINVDGEQVDPESALEDYDIESLSGYIQDATADIIIHSITEYELSKDIDVEELAIQMLNDQYSFVDLVEAAKDADIIEY